MPVELHLPLPHHISAAGIARKALVERFADRVYGEVVDEGGGFERELRERGPDDLGGRGLLIVDALCSRSP